MKMRALVAGKLFLVAHCRQSAMHQPSISQLLWSSFWINWTKKLSLQQFLASKVFHHQTSSDGPIREIGFRQESGCRRGLWTREVAGFPYFQVSDVKGPVQIEVKYTEQYVSTTDASSANISLNTNCFLLAAVLDANNTAIAKYLLDNRWAAMLNKHSSGASWKYAAQDQFEPGTESFHLSEPSLGGAPTYVLTEQVAGIHAETPGHKSWAIQPAISGFDLDWAAASVKTQYGQLSVKREISGSILTVNVDAPRGTSGKLQHPSPVALRSRVSRSTGTRCLQRKSCCRAGLLLLQSKLA